MAGRRGPSGAARATSDEGRAAGALGAAAAAAGVAATAAPADTGAGETAAGALAVRLGELPDDVVLRVGALLAPRDLCALMGCSRRLVELCQRDALWRPRCRKSGAGDVCGVSSAAAAGGLLGGGAYGALRQEAFGKAVMRVGKTLELAPGSAHALCWSGFDRLCVLVRDGTARLISLAAEGRCVWSCDLRAQAQVLAAQDEREQKRLELAAVHKNRLFQLKLQRATANERFNLWDDGDEPDASPARAPRGSAQQQALAACDREQAVSLAAPGSVVSGNANNISSSNNNNNQALAFSPIMPSSHASAARAVPSSRRGACARARAREREDERAPDLRCSDELAPDSRCLDERAFGSSHCSLGSSPLLSSSLYGSEASSYSSDLSVSVGSESEPRTAGSEAAMRMRRSVSACSVGSQSSIEPESGGEAGEVGEASSNGSSQSHKAKKGKARKPGAHPVKQRRNSLDKSGEHEVAIRLDPACGCASLVLDSPAPNAWYVVQVGVRGCQQQRLSVPRWQRDADAPLLCSAFSPALQSAPFQLGPRLLAQQQQRHERSSSSSSSSSSGASALSDVGAPARSPGLPAVVAATGHANGAILLWGPGMAFVGAILAQLPVVHLRLAGRTVVSAHSDDAVRVWDHSARLLGRMPVGAPVTALVAAHGEWIVAGTAAGKVLLWRDMRLVAALAAHAGAVCCVAIAPLPLPGPCGALVLASGGEDGNVALRRFEWDNHAQPREVQVRLLLGHQGPVRDVYVDEYKTVSCGEDGAIKFWDLAGHEPRTLRTLKFRKGNKTLPILSLVVAPTFVIGARSDASVVGFTLHNSWAALQQPPDAAARPAPATGIATPVAKDHKKKSAPRRALHHQPRTRRETPPPSANELAEMLFEDQFDAWDLQFEHC